MTYYPLLMVLFVLFMLFNLVLSVIYMVSIRHLQGGTGKLCLFKVQVHVPFFYTSLLLMIHIKKKCIKLTHHNKLFVLHSLMSK